ncbi:hypothetical protein FNB79_07875 [Formosa sediminum]|uniref:Uncharacterized protein n=1 Tax=Formosa sediminum TaxID=2594004 RepID=A0A516GQV9_9FLAO|nr:hypothetical protein [Formosa sediminum]QDO93905.1 hypothetical protein FNB79_07875 [Formosa sediminum]
MMKSFRQFFKSVVQACPYTHVGKRCINVVTRKSEKSTQIPKNAAFFKAGMKTGRNIALVGVFCPFLWFSILSGGTKDFIILNAIHSGIIVCLGLSVMGVNYLSLWYFKRKLHVNN